MLSVSVNSVPLWLIIPARLLDSFQKGELGSVIEIEPRQIGRSSDGSSRYREPFLTAYSGITQNSG